MQVGGTPAVLKYLLERKLIHGDCLTCTGKLLKILPSRNYCRYQHFFNIVFAVTVLVLGLLLFLFLLLFLSLALSLSMSV